MRELLLSYSFILAESSYYFFACSAVGFALEEYCKERGTVFKQISLAEILFHS